MTTGLRPKLKKHRPGCRNKANGAGWQQQHRSSSVGFRYWAITSRAVRQVSQGSPPEARDSAVAIGTEGLAATPILKQHDHGAAADEKQPQQPDPGQSLPEDEE